MADLIDPVVLGFQSEPAGDMDRLILLLPEDWTAVFLRPYSDELREQVRQENEADDIDYVVVFSQGTEEKFWLYNCVEGLGLGLDDDGDPFLQVEFEADLASEEIFDGTDFYVGFEDKAHTYTLFDHLVNILDPEATAPLPEGLAHDAAVDGEAHPNVADARAKRLEDGLV